MEVKILKAYKSEYVEGAGIGYIISVVEGNEIVLRREVYIFLNTGSRIEKEALMLSDIELLGTKELFEKEDEILDVSLEYANGLLSVMMQKHVKVRITDAGFKPLKYELKEIPRYDAVRDLNKKDQSICQWVISQTRCSEIERFCTMVGSIKQSTTARDVKKGFAGGSDKQ